MPPKGYKRSPESIAKQQRSIALKKAGKSSPLVARDIDPKEVIAYLRQAEKLLKGLDDRSLRGVKARVMLALEALGD